MSEAEELIKVLKSNPQVIMDIYSENLIECYIIQAAELLKNGQKETNEYNKVYSSIIALILQKNQ